MRTTQTLIGKTIASALTATSLLVPQAISAQTDKIEIDKPLDIFVVIGRRLNHELDIASNINTIDQQDIIASGAKDLADLLRGQAGIQISDSNSGPTFSIRGFTGKQAVNNTLILVDGRRLNNIDISSADVSSIGLNQILRIEVLSGSAGVLYGDQAVGGVINIITKSPQTSQGNVQLLVGSWDHKRANASVSGAISDTWSYYLNGQYNKNDNYREHNASKTGNALGRLEYKDNSSRFFVEANHSDNHRLYAGSLTEAQYKENPRQANSGSLKDHSHTITNVARTGWRQELNSIWQADIELTHSDSDSKGFQFGSNRKDRTLTSLYSKFIADYPTQQGNINWIIGSDITIGKASFSSGFLNRSNTQTTAALYTQAIIPLNQSISYTVGGRYASAKDELTDKNIYPTGTDLSENATAFELALNYQLNKINRLYLRAETNFRFAKVDEQAYTSPNVHGLKPQTGKSFEAGWSFTPLNHTIKLNLFRLELTDEIVFDPRAQKPKGGTFNGANVNADASRRNGMSINWNWQLNDNITLGAEYNYIDAVFTEGKNTGKHLSWVAKHNARVNSQIDFTNNLQLSLSANYIGSRYLEGDNANLGNKIPDYVLVNTALNYQLEDWRVTLSAENLADKSYISSGFFSKFGSGFYIGNGRNINLSINYQF
ncbi:TonB-dependent receptor [Parashewanella curva]|uniref:TonB-dependent receptor n=1 Tax=Parashewanella curva TaxID=2338552 RepID=A0A3L8PT61_9GAMM|nr:TonB-dependent receptor [Parashewanella curva]RLV58526.1 TonB-dependent receptor [Parashewanella curva]